MFSINEITDVCNYKSFARGMSMVNDETVCKHRSFKVNDDECVVYGTVRSVSGIAEHFNCYLDLSSDCDRIIASYCDCPAARKYAGMCKHCVVLALTFRDNPKSFSGYDETLTLKTSGALKAYMDAQPNFNEQRAQKHSIHLKVRLINNFDAWSLRLWISDENVEYVVSDISSFAHALSCGLYLSYGKRLGFVHDISSFDEKSAPIASLISEIVANSRVVRKELILSELDTARMLDALGSQTFELAESFSGKNVRSVYVEDDDPILWWRVLKKREGGFVLLCDSGVRVVEGSLSSYVFFDDFIFRTSAEFSGAAHFLRSVYQVYCDEIYISENDIGQFCQKVLYPLQDVVDIEYPPELESYLPHRAEFSFYLDREGKGKEEAITLEIKVRYGMRERTLWDVNGLVNEGGSPQNNLPTSSFLDEEIERNIAFKVYEYFQDGGKILLSDIEAAGSFLYGGLAEFRKLGDVFTTPKFDRLINSAPIRTEIGLSLSGDLIDMDVHSSDVSSEELAAILSSLKKRRRFHRLRDGAFASIEALDLHNLERLSNDLNVSPKDIVSGKVTLPAYYAFLLDREYAEAQRDKSFQEYIERFENDSLYDYAVPGSLSQTLRPYQVEGYRWMRKLASIGFGGILADEMGLGKSVQLISFLLALLDKGECSSSKPALIVAPASLVYNWVEEFTKFAPNVDICAVDGSAPERRRKRNEAKAQVYVVSYDTVRIDIDAFRETKYSVIVLDEAQFIKNHATKTSRAVRRLLGTYRFALTGTPIENRLSEIWSIFDFLMPGFLGSYAQFRQRFEMDIIGGDEHVAHRLKSLVSPFVLRRLKEDVLDELPAKQESVVSVPLAEEQRKLYLAEEQSLRNSLLAQRQARKSSKNASLGEKIEAKGLKVDVLAELMRLRQVALDPNLCYENYTGQAAKTDVIMELICQCISSGEKALVFSQFTSYLSTLERELESRDILYYEITGSTRKKSRVEMASAFNEDDVPVFLVSLKAGGTGLNLTGASVVIHCDPWWNAAAIDQASDRAHRIGQKRMVSVYKIIAKDTIEERILRLQESKRHLADTIVEANSTASLSSLTREELEKLLLQ